MDEENTERSEQFISDLFFNIPKQKYAITHSSGNKAWPWYEPFAPDARLSVDSIMPPHTIFHVIKPYQEGMTHKQGDYLIEAVLKPPAEDGAPVLKFSMFQFRAGEWERVVDLDDHAFGPAKYPTYLDQYRILEETIIRSSFK